MIYASDCARHVDDTLNTDSRHNGVTIYMGSVLKQLIQGRTIHGAA